MEHISMAGHNIWQQDSETANRARYDCHGWSRCMLLSSDSADGILAVITVHSPTNSYQSGSNLHSTIAYSSNNLEGNCTGSCL